MDLCFGEERSQAKVALSETPVAGNTAPGRGNQPALASAGSGNNSDSPRATSSTVAKCPLSPPRPRTRTSCKPSPARSAAAVILATLLGGQQQPQQQQQQHQEQQVVEHGVDTDQAGVFSAPSARETVTPVGTDSSSPATINNQEDERVASATGLSARPWLPVQTAAGAAIAALAGHDGPRVGGSPRLPGRPQRRSLLWEREGDAPEDAAEWGLSAGGDENQSTPQHGVGGRRRAGISRSSARGERGSSAGTPGSPPVAAPAVGAGVGNGGGGGGGGAASPHGVRRSPRQHSSRVRLDVNHDVDQSSQGSVIRERGEGPGRLFSSSSGDEGKGGGGGRGAPGSE
ncbi:unnamed protein product, partial [Scytosiphon promiscuus]